ncbi:MAG: FAD-dependent thymidylate synthase [Candidatus Portnoybacteria bacterium]|nr:FAD-dependent thymidylate synthase [Candidatus Portnoybacteria bacterium]
MIETDRWKHLREGLFRNVEPKVELMAMTQPVGRFVSEFTSEAFPGYVARWSHETKMTGPAGDIARNVIMREKVHTTPTEFLDFSFSVDGISKSLQNQWVRQRIGVSWVFRSTRYIPANQNRFVYCTFDYVDDEEQAKELLGNQELAAKKAIEMYDAQILLGTNPQDGRKIMPVLWNTPCAFKANVQSLRHFFTLRLDKKAEWEIRRLARMIFDIVIEIAPSLFVDMKELYETGKKSIVISKEELKKLAQKMLSVEELKELYETGVKK